MTLVLLFLSKQGATRPLMLAMVAVEVANVRLSLLLLFAVTPLGGSATTCRPLRKNESVLVFLNSIRPAIFSASCDIVLTLFKFKFE